MELLAESFNISNTPWFDRPDTNIGGAAFGQVTTAQGTQTVKVNMNRSFPGQPAHRLLRRFGPGSIRQ